MSVDRLGPKPHVGDTLSGRRVRFVEADPVVRHRYDAPPTLLRDGDLDVPGSGMTASVPQPLLDYPEHLYLLVRREPNLGIHIELDVELPVSCENLDVPA